jgi:hypothetical protein
MNTFSALIVITDDRFIVQSEESENAGMGA